MSVFDEVKDKLRIEDVVEETVRLRKQGRAMQGFCPFHDNHNTPALAVWPETQTWKCFAGCGQGDVFDWVEKREQVDKRGALELLARMAGVELGTLTPEQFKTSEKRKEASKVAGAAVEFFRKALASTSSANEYALSRGWTDEVIKAEGLGYFGKSDWDSLRKHLSDAGVDVECPAAVALLGYRGDVAAWGKKWGAKVTADEIAEGKVRAMPPEMLMYCHAEGRSVVYVSGRRLPSSPTLLPEGEGGSVPKSWNPPVELFGERRPYFNRCFQHGKPVTLVEGQGDAVTLEQWGIAGVAMAGVSTDNSLLSVLVKGGLVTVALDNDQAGIAAATGLVAHGQTLPITERVKRSVCWRLVEEGLAANRVRVMRWEIGDGEIASASTPRNDKDANDCLKAGMTAEQAGELVKGAPTWLDVLVEFCAETEQDEDERGEARLLVFELLAGCDPRWVIERKKKFTKSLDYDLDTFEHLLVEARKHLGQDEAGRPLYAVSNGRIVHNCYDRMGNPYEQTLFHGSIEIRRDVVKDDGEQQERIFEVEGKTVEGVRLGQGEVEAGEFGRMDWLLKLWGRRAVMPAGQSVKDHLRAAVLLLSNDAQESYTYAHTGWRTVNGKPVFLSPMGAIGTDGVCVEVPSALASYRMPVHPEQARREEAVKASLRFLNVGDLYLTIPVLAAGYLAPLSSIVPPAFTLWLHGTTGSMKSTLIALMMCHFGWFTWNTPPSSWTSTAVGLRTLAFILKDTPLWIDDFTKQSTIRGNEEIAKRADELLRDWGNRAGAVKGRADGGLRVAHRPRGLIISTAEQLPAGQSILARLFAVEAAPGMVTRGPGSALSAAQAEDATLYAEAMAWYVLWLAEHYAELERDLPMRQRLLVERAQAAGQHLRAPMNVATMALGFETMMQFIRSVGVVTEEERAGLNESAWNYLTAIGESQQEIVAVEENPVEMFFRALDEMMLQGLVYLRHVHAMAEMVEQTTIPKNRMPSARMIGYYNDTYLYLLPDAAFNSVVSFYRESVRVFPDTAHGLKSKLREQGALFPDNDRFTCKVRTGTGDFPRVLRIARAYTDRFISTLCVKSGDIGDIGDIGDNKESEDNNNE